jgi:hypothetical protein
MSWSGTLVDFKDGVSYTGAVNSDTTPTFTLLGGKYALIGYSSGTVSSTVNISADNTHFVGVAAAVTTNYTTYDLPPGSYQIVMGGSSSTQAGALIRIPYRAA